MVLNRRIADTSFLARPKFKIKQPLMEPVTSGVPAMRGNKNTTTSRWSSLVAGTNAGNGNVVNASVASSSGGNGIPVPTASSTQPTTHQKVRRILEEHAIWEERANGQQGIRARGPSPSPSSSSSINSNLGNYNIVASRGELSRSSFAVRETPALVARRNRHDEIASFFVNGREDSLGRSSGRLQVQQNGRDSRAKIQHSQSNWEKRAASRENDRSSSRSRNSRNCAQTLSKSSSVPANLKSVTGGSGPLNTAGTLRPGGKVPGEGILRKSSAFLASLTHSGVKNFNERKSNGIGSVSRSGRKDIDGIAGWNDSGCKEEKSRFSLLRRNAPLVANRGGESSLGLRRSPSCQNLSNVGKKKGVRVGVKKSVSFSSDTSFEEKRAPFRKTAVHEAKVYRKGVLREINAGENPIKKVPATWETPPGDPKALLRASREADDLDLKELISRIRKSGIGQMDVNATDSSGRTAISYMAGNGAAVMLEATLSFPGSDPNLPDNEGNTPLHFAAQAGQIESLNILLQRCPGIEVDARNILGFTPLMKAALQGRTKCAKILLFAGANPTLRDHGRGLRAEQWARFCGRYVCAEVIERFARHRLMEKSNTCRWGSEPELATKVLQGKVIPVPAHPLPPASTGFRSKIKRVFRTTSGPDRSFSLVSQLTSAALCASTPALPKPGEIPPAVKSLIRPLSVPQLRVTLATQSEIIEKTTDKYGLNFTEKIESAIAKPPRAKKKNK